MGLQDEIRTDIDAIASAVAGDDFWIDGRPFILQMGEEYAGQLEEEYGGAAAVAVLDWIPQGTFGFAAMCNDPVDHRVLARLCLRFAKKEQGLVDLGGALLPPIQGAVEQLFKEHFLSGTGGGWSDWEPHVAAYFQDHPGRLLTVLYQTGRGDDWATHVCDVQFLEAWLRHEHFHMIK